MAVPLEQWNLIGSALKAAHTAVEAVAPPYEAYILDVEGALQKMIAATSEGSSKDRLLRAVLTPDELVPTVAEAAVLHYGATISNTVDKEYLMGWRKHSADAIARRDRLRTMHVAKIVSLHCRMKNEFSTPPIIIMETIERAFQGTTYYDWQRQCRGRSVMGPTWLVEAMKGLDNWVPPSRLVQRCEKRFSIQYSFSVRDNLEFWLRKKWSGRVKDGEKVDTEVLHTTTGLNMPIPTSIMIEDTPEMEDWPYMNSWDVQLCVLRSFTRMTILSLVTMTVATMMMMEVMTMMTLMASSLRTLWRSRLPRRLHHGLKKISHLVSGERPRMTMSHV